MTGIGRTRWHKIGAIFLLGTILSFLFVGQNIIAALTTGQKFKWQMGVLFETIYWYALAAVIPLVIWAARRYRLEKKDWSINLFKHFLCNLLAVSLQTFVTFTVFLSLISYFNLVSNEEFSVLSSRLQPALAANGFATFWKYWVIIGFYYAIDYYRKFHEREAKSAQLEKSLALANLQNLKMQLHPHFLFNTLHAISVLMLEDTTAANRMLVRMSDLLRLALNTNHAQEVPLKEDLDFIKLYLEIEKIRFSDRLHVNFNIEPMTLDAQVPSLLLQPLIENSLKHGISSRKARGFISIKAVRVDSFLQLTVSDNGVGMESDKEAAFRSGIGLSNTKARLEYLYGSDYKLDLVTVKSGGLTVVITLPFKESLAIKN